MGKRQRIKTEALEFVPENRSAADEAIRVIGEMQRQRDELRTRMNEELAAVKARYEADAQPIAASIKSLSAGVQVWAEANRVDLTKDGKTKTVRLGNGEIRWRMRPPSVTVRMADAAIEALKKLGLGRFIRTKEEIDKEAILKEPDAVEGVRGIVVGQGEDFVIVPFATELEEVV
jgi:phage host-nuclease inhibitor protein Gam